MYEPLARPMNAKFPLASVVVVAALTPVSNIVTLCRAVPDEVTVPDMLYIVAAGAGTESLLLPHATKLNETTAVTKIQTATHTMPFLISTTSFES